MKAIHTILHDHLSVQKLCNHWIPHNLNEAQKQVRVKWSKEMLKKFNQDQIWSTTSLLGTKHGSIRMKRNKQQSTVWVFQNELKPTELIETTMN